MHFSKDMQQNATPVAVPAALAGFDFATPQPANAYRTWAKRAFDVAAIVLCLPLVLPLIALMAAAVAIRGGNPFYAQARVGKGGHIYTMWKLRTMVMDADAALKTHLANNPAARAEWAVTQKLKSDPRITTVGRILRKTSMDELPQLLNVLRGDMSLVGPRPMLPEQQAMYPGTAYYNLAPGITGLWQVSARNEAAFADRAHYDTAYDRSLSFMQDLRTLIATVRVVTRATGH